MKLKTSFSGKSRELEERLGADHIQRFLNITALELKLKLQIDNELIWEIPRA